MNYSAAPRDLTLTRLGMTQTRGWRIVMAEDEALPAELLKRMLTRLGHTVVGSAQNGLEAIEQTRRLRPEIVLMDLRMPVMDGWTAMATLGGEALAPIVVVSALDDRESLEQAVEAGASGFLTKPVREADLERALELAVARFADMQEIRKWRADAEQRADAQKTQAEALIRALSELREAQLRLVMAARRAAMTSLAQSLTHEINNALTPIIGYAQMIELQHATDAETSERARQIVELARRIAGWTAAFRQLSVGARRERISFSLNGIAQDALYLYEERFTRLGIAVETDWDPQLPLMLGFPDQLREVLINLIQNAIEAMRAGGSLRAQSRYLATDEILLTLTDSGTGIDAADLPRVTEPGFSTKRLASEDNSVGWGLFTANQIIQAQRGVLEIISPPAPDGQGTMARIRLPVNADWEDTISRAAEQI